MDKRTVNFDIDKIDNACDEELRSYDLDRLKTAGISKTKGIHTCFYPAYVGLENYSRGKDLSTDIKRFDIYVHIPFCSRKCSYCIYSCDFTNHRKKQYMEALFKEIESYEDKEYYIDYLDIGGGTPTTLDIDEITALIDKIKKSFKIDERSVLGIEVHPEIARSDDLDRYLKNLKDLGITAFSVGVESFDDTLLRKMNRGHDSKDVRDIIGKAKEYFEDIRIDIIYGFDGCTIDNWKQTIVESLNLDINDVGGYMFIPSAKSSNSPLPERDLIKMELIMIDSFIRSGWSPGGFMSTEFRFRKKRKEFSNPDIGLRIIGIGNSAYTLTDTYVGVNAWSIDEYIDKVNLQGNGMSLYKRMDTFEKFMNCLITNILFNARINLEFFRKKFGMNVLERYPDVIRKLIELDLAVIKGNLIVLTKLGVLFSNQVVSMFLPEEYIAEYRKALSENGSIYRKYIENSPFGFDIK